MYNLKIMFYNSLIRNKFNTGESGDKSKNLKFEVSCKLIGRIDHVTKDGQQEGSLDLINVIDIAQVCFVFITLLIDFVSIARVREKVCELWFDIAEIYLLNI